jgi:PAS domain S-box-containing protein
MIFMKKIDRRLTDCRKYLLMLYLWKSRESANNMTNTSLAPKNPRKTDMAIDEGGTNFRVLAEMAPLAVFILQGTGFAYVNPAGERLTGFTAEELYKRKFYDLFPAGSKRSMRKWGLQVQHAESLSLHGDFNFITANGDECWIDVTATSINHAGKPAAIITAFELNEKRREEILQDVIYRIAKAADGSKTLDDLFPALHAIIAEVMVAKNFYIALYDRKEKLITYPYYLDEYDHPARKVKPEKGLTEYVLRTGKSLLCDANLHRTLETQGDIALIGHPSPIWLGVPLIIDNVTIGVMVVQDYEIAVAYGIREQRILEFVSSQVAMAIRRKQSEDALRESAERYRRLVEFGPEVVAVHCEGKIVYINQVGVSLVGAKTADEILGRQVMDFVHPDYNAIVRQRIKETQEEARVGAAIYEKFVRLDGSVIDVEVTAIPISYEGKPATQVVFHDITERKQVEDALRESEARFRRRAEELSALYETTREIASHHDTKTLLQTIVDRAALLLNAAGGSIYLREVEHDELVLKVAHGQQDFVGMKMGSGEGLLGEVVQSLQPAVVADYRVWKNRSSKFDTTPITALMAAPMLYSGELVGVLSVNEIDTGSGQPIRKYTSSEIEQLTFFAGAAASAVHNARLFEETQQRLVELEVLYQASLSAAQIHSPGAVAQRIVDTLEHLVNWNGSIWLVEDQRLVLLAVSTLGFSGRAFKDMFTRLAGLLTSLDDGIIGWVTRNGRAIRTGKVKDNPHYIQEREDVKSELCVPLRVGGKTIGCINVESVIPDAFGEHDERLLTTLANQAAVAIENARLFEETRRRASRQIALNAIIRASARTGSSLDEILEVALEQTLKALGLDMGAIWLSWSMRGIQRVVSKGIPSAINTLMADASFSGKVSLSRTLAITDWQKLTHPYSDLFLSMGVHATIMVPLMSEDKRIGGMAVCSTDACLWTTDEVALVEAIGREVGLAAERARLFEETTSRLKEMEAVTKVSTALRLAKSMNGMLPQLMEETLHALDTETGAIWVFDPDRSKLRQLIGRGWCLKLAQIELDRGENLMGNVLNSEDVYFSANVARDPYASQELRELAPLDWCAVCVPIRTEMEVIGIFIVSTPLPREFNAEDARLLITLADIAGNAIHRMQLNEKFMEHATELELRVTERTAELRTALQKAQAADRVKSEFIANINHELRTPLTNLLLYYQMLRSQPTVKTEERLDVIGRELQRLRNLIEDLLNLSHLDLGHMAYRPALCDLNGLIQTLVRDRQELARDRGLSLRSELQPDLGPVILDAPTIVQAVSNLITNALNYTPSGGEVLISTMQVEQDDKQFIAFKVEDTGYGIDAEDLPHIFERFYRGAAGRQTGAPGTGLGLAIVKQVVDHHNGRIEVQNRASGRGAIFTVWLPLKPLQETS